VHLLISDHCQGLCVSGAASGEGNGPYRPDRSFPSLLVHFDGGRSNNGLQWNLHPGHFYFPLKIISNYLVIGNSLSILMPLKPLPDKVQCYCLSFYCVFNKSRIFTSSLSNGNFSHGDGAG